MKYKKSHRPLIIFWVVMLLFQGCIKKDDIILKYSRQKEREESGNVAWWLKDMKVNMSISPFIEYYKQNPGSLHMLSWELSISKDANKLSDIDWIYISEYINVQAYLSLMEIMTLVRQNPDVAVPDEYSYLVPKAKYFYILEDMKKPVLWKMYDLCYAFLSCEELFETIKNHYREILIKPDRKSRAILFRRVDTNEFEIKLSITITENGNIETTESILENVEIFFDYYCFFPGRNSRKITRDSHNSISVYLREQPVNRDNYLSFHLIDQKSLGKLSQGLSSTENKTAFLLGFDAGLPLGTGLRVVLDHDKEGFPVINSYTLIHEDILFDNSYIESAALQYAPSRNRPIVAFELSLSGAEVFYEITKIYEGELIALVINDMIVFSARISEPIRNGRVKVSGQGISVQDAKELVKYLNMN